jgi:hypothetical protein
MRSVSVIDKVLQPLTAAEATGILRRDLLVQAAVPAVVLSDVLRFLTSRGELREEKEQRAEGDRSAFLRGRPATRYFYTASGEPYPDELPATFCTPAVREPTTAPVPHGMDGPAACVWCGSPLPLQFTGRPRQFCKAECRTASVLAASQQLLGILQRPRDPYVFNTVARVIVAADLMSRGCRVHGAFEGTDLIVQLGKQLLRVGVYIADTAGTSFEGDDSTDARAVVRRDGAIRYSGLDFIDDAEPEKTEPPVGDEPAGGEGAGLR